MTAVVLMATPCTKSLGGGTGRHKHGGYEGMQALLDRRLPPFLGRRAAVDKKVMMREREREKGGFYDDDVYYYICQTLKLEGEGRRLGFIENTARRHRRGG